MAAKVPECRGRGVCEKFRAPSVVNLPGSSGICLTPTAGCSHPPLAEVPSTGPGPKAISVYLVSKRDSYVVVAQLSPEFTARLVDRWQELEAAVVAPPRALTPAEMFLQNAQAMVGLETSDPGTSG